MNHVNSKGLRVVLVSGLLFVVAGIFASPVEAAAVAVTGKAKVLNTDNSYLDFTSYNANVKVDSSSGVFSGYAFLEDLGWVAFGTTDNSLGPVSLNLTTGAVTGKAKVLNTGAYLDFTSYGSNVTATIPTGVFSGYVFSEDAGWINFSDLGVTGLLAPVLQSPANDSYIASAYPTFRFQKSLESLPSAAAANTVSTTASYYTIEIDPGSNAYRLADVNIYHNGTDEETKDYYLDYDGDYIALRSKQATKAIIAGNHTCRIRVYDTLGRMTYADYSFKADFTAPTLPSVTLPDALGQVGGYQVFTDLTPTVAGTLQDDLAVNKVELLLYKQNFFLSVETSQALYLAETFNYAISGTSWNFSVTPSQHLDYGKYLLQVKGYDQANNAATQTFYLQILTGSKARALLAQLTPSSQVSQVTPSPAGERPTISLPALEKQAKTIRKQEINWLASLWQSVAGRGPLVKVGEALRLAWQSIKQPAQQGAGLLYRIRMGVSTFYAWVFDPNPTVVSDVTIEEVGANFAVLSWKTNHYTMANKVNYGLDLKYGQEIWADQGDKYHVAKITGLKPGTNYFFEVMSQNKNYAFDAYYTFTTTEN